jgi:hypothetical protein
VTTTTGRPVAAGMAATLEESYSALVKSGRDSVRAAWRFGQCCDSFTDDFTVKEQAEALDLSSGTIARYLRFYRAFQRPELAVEASTRLETYNIDLITEMAGSLKPVEHGRPLAGRRYRYRCHHCDSIDVAREEIPADELDAEEVGV